jgi:hypothetical protein
MQRWRFLSLSIVQRTTSRKPSLRLSLSDTNDSREDQPVHNCVIISQFSVKVTGSARPASDVQEDEGLPSDFTNSLFRRVRKIAKRDYYHRHFCPSVCPHSSNRLSLDGFSFLSIFRKCSKFQLWLHFDKNNGHFTWRPIHIFDNNYLSSSTEKCFGLTLYCKSTHILWSITSLENRAVYEIMWKNVVE